MLWYLVFFLHSIKRSNPDIKLSGFVENERFYKFLGTGLMRPISK